VVRALQLRLPLADCLGVAAEETGDVLNPTVAQLRGLNRRIAPPIPLTQGIEQYNIPKARRELIPGPFLSYHVFHTAECLQQEFPDAKILPSVQGEMQGCCLIRRAASAP